MFLSVFSSSSEFRYLEGGVGRRPQVGTFILLKYAIEDLPYLQPNHLHRNVYILHGSSVLIYLVSA